jgi:hypothetical protein
MGGRAKLCAATAAGVGEDGKGGEELGKREWTKREERSEDRRDVSLRFDGLFPCLSEGASSELLVRSLHMRIPSAEICSNSERRF